VTLPVDNFSAACGHGNTRSANTPWPYDDRTCVLGWRHGATELARLEVLPAPMRPRARMGTGPDHCDLDALLPARAGRAATRRGAPASVLPDGRLRIGLVPPAACRGRRRLEAA
jgi:hypothetical protein